MGGISVGRGAGIVMAFAGVALVIVSVSLLFMKEVKFLEKKSGEKSDDRAQFCQEGATDDSKAIME